MYSRHRYHRRHRNSLKFDITRQVNPKKIQKQGQIIRSDPVNCIERPLISRSMIEQAVAVLRTYSIQPGVKTTSMNVGDSITEGTSVLKRISLGDWCSLIEDQIIEFVRDNMSCRTFGIGMTLYSITITCEENGFSGSITIDSLGDNSDIAIAPGTHFCGINQYSQDEVQVVKITEDLSYQLVSKTGEGVPDMNNLYERIVTLTNQQITQMIKDHSWNILSEPNEILLDLVKTADDTFIYLVNGELNFVGFF